MTKGRQMAKVGEGDMAPDFTLPTEGDGSFTLSDKRGSPVILFFYPKDDTSGCTKEAIGFSQHLDEFKALGCIVAGMSPDPAKKHDKFIAKHDLTTTLISDEEKTALEAYGVWVEKSMYGKKYMGVNRTTLIIDADGKIIKEWSKVKVPGHVEEVLETAKALFA
jgi:peroxiredoxin Q/BCP